MKAWMRILTVSLSNGKNKLVFGDNDEASSYNFDIHVSGSKFMSSLKDTCRINISNLSYETIVQIIQGKYYDVEIKCGYKSFGAITIFKGSVLYISNILESDRTHTICILCSSSLLAKYGQSRMNLSLNSGINIYTALKYISAKAGIKSQNISNQLKKSFSQGTKTANETAASWLNRFATDNKFLVLNSDGLDNATFSIFDASKGRSRTIKLDNKLVNLDGGYPKMTKDGLNLSVMPTFSFACGDTIQIDNSLIDISVTNQSEVQNNLGYYLDKEGYYMIFEINYELENHASQFTIQMRCKAFSRISNYISAQP